MQMCIYINLHLPYRASRLLLMLLTLFGIISDWIAAGGFSVAAVTQWSMISRYSSSQQLGKVFCLSVLTLAALITITITGSNFSVKQKTTLKILLEPIDDSGEKTESRVNSLNSERQQLQQAASSSILISEQTAAALPDYNVTHWQPDWYTHTDDDIGNMLNIRRTAIIHRYGSKTWWYHAFAILLSSQSTRLICTLN